MQSPARITFKNTEPSAAVEARVHEHIAHLERFHPELIGCHVEIAALPVRARLHAAHDVQIELHTPDRVFRVRSETQEQEAYLDVFVALRDAFDAAKRLLRQQAAERNGEPHRSTVSRIGTIEHLAKGYGRIAADDGHTVYFHRNCLRDTKFGALSVGTIVEFEEELGNHGPQAATVRPWRGSSSSPND
ncbi:MAG TPA: HPF/RaiA family ribosome-associated protein [Steroidobacteraceae bacterium]